MGGIGSGRTGGNGTTEGALTLDLAQCMRQGRFTAGLHVQGSITWTRGCSGKPIASIGYQANMCDPGNAWVQLTHSTEHRGEKTVQNYRIKLTTSRPHLGGVRWWFICPASGRRVRCLHLVGGFDRFAGRQFLRLGYQSQRDDWTDQRLRAARVADAKLGGNGNLIDGAPPKPKWMRWPTYRRLAQERDRAMAWWALVTL